MDQYFVRGQIVPESTGFTEKGEAENLLKQRIRYWQGAGAGPERATIADLCSLVIEDYRHASCGILST